MTDEEAIKEVDGRRNGLSRVARDMFCRQLFGTNMQIVKFVLFIVAHGRWVVI